MRLPWNKHRLGQLSGVDSFKATKYIQGNKEFIYAIAFKARNLLLNRHSPGDLSIT